MSTRLAKTAAFTPQLERGFFILAACLGVFFLIRAIFTLIEPSRAYNAPPALSQPAITVTGQISSTQLFIDPDFDPFHRLFDLRPAGPRSALIGEGAPETDLDIILKGRRAFENGNGSAILRLPDGQESNFKRGDTIFKDVVLEAIYPTHIIISRKGKQERVTFERASGVITETPSNSRADDPLEAAPANDVEADTPKSLSQARKALQTRTGNTRKRNTRAFTTQEATGVLSAVRPSPVRKDGRFIGYRLRGAASSDELSKFGLKSTDVITQIDGQNLPNKAADLPAIFNRLSKDTSGTTFTVERDGQVLVLSAN